MPNEIFQKSQTNNNIVNQFMNNLNECRQNPFAFLIKRRFNIPENLQNNPDAIAQHLMNTGQMNQQQYEYLRNVKQQIESNFK